MIKPTRTLEEWEEYVYQSDSAQEKSLDVTAAVMALYIDALTSIEKSSDTNDLDLKDVQNLSEEIVPYLNDLAALVINDIKEIHEDEEDSEES